MRYNRANRTFIPNNKGLITENPNGPVIIYFLTEEERSNYPYIAPAKDSNGRIKRKSVTTIAESKIRRWVK